MVKRNRVADRRRDKLYKDAWRQCQYTDFRLEPGLRIMESFANTFILVYRAPSASQTLACLLDFLVSQGWNRGMLIKRDGFEVE